jgi:anti-sigma factor RsiW
MTRGNDNIIQGDGHVLDALSVYIDDAMEPDEQEQVRAHIADCEDCHVVYLEMRATRQMLNALPTIAPPRAFTLTQEMAAPRTSFWQRVFAPRYAPRFATGSALAFGLLVLILISDLGLMVQDNANAPAGIVAVPMSEDRFAKPGSTATATWRQYGFIVTPPAAMMQATAAAVSANMATPAAGGSEITSNLAAEATATTGAPTAAGAPPGDYLAIESATLSAQQTAEIRNAIPMQGSRPQSGESYPAIVPRAEGKQSDTRSDTQSDTTRNVNSGRIVLTALEVALALLAAGLMLGALLARKSRA